MTDRPAAPRRRSPLALVLAISIAAVSVLGALAGWRAEVHASRSGVAEQNAVAASIVLTEVGSNARREADIAARRYARWEHLDEETRRLGATGCVQPAGNSLQLWHAYVACQTRTQFSGYNDPAYVDPTTGFRQHELAQDVAAADRLIGVTDPEQSIRTSESERHSEDRMLYLSLGLVVVLALFTLARMMRRRWLGVALAVPAWIGIVVFVVIGVAAET